MDERTRNLIGHGLPWQKELAVQRNTHCRACHTMIAREASICPQCHSQQRNNTWHSLGNILKWTGAATAIISLLLTLNKVDQLLGERQLRTQRATMLVQTGALQSAQADYAGAWQSYREALQLVPGKQQAQKAQVQLAMRWLRNITVTQGESFSQIIEPIIPVLYQGATQAADVEYATLMAHLGWAHYLRFREGKISNPQQVTNFFIAARERDSSNAWANGMEAFWILYRGGELDLALTKFAVAMQAKESHQAIGELKLHALLQRNSAAAAQAAVATAIALYSKDSQPPQARLVHRILRLYTARVYDDEAFTTLLGDVVIQQHIALFKLLTSGMAEKPKMTLVEIRLLQQAGEDAEAQTLISQMMQHMPPYSDAIQHTLLLLQKGEENQ